MQDSNRIKIPKGWNFRRGYIPHFDGGPLPQSVTFRLIDSFPAAKLLEWELELRLLSADQATLERLRRIEDYLDLGTGHAWLAEKSVADAVQQSLIWFDMKRYQLHAWVVMPNHVHVLFSPEDGCELADIVHSWKSFSALAANKLLKRSGTFWQPDYFDRFIRDEPHFYRTIAYIEANPLKAGLCQDPKAWVHSSAAFRSTE